MLLKDNKNAAVLDNRRNAVLDKYTNAVLTKYNATSGSGDAAIVPTQLSGTQCEELLMQAAADASKVNYTHAAIFLAAGMVLMYFFKDQIAKMLK